MKRNSGNTLLLVLVILAFVGVVALYYTKQKSKLVPVLQNQQSAQSSPTRTESSLPASPTAQAYSDPNIKTFTSDDLGIRFSYLEKQQIPGIIGTKQVGNKVYVYDTSLPADQGQYIEVFTKIVADSLVQAITKQFLKDYNSTDCFAEKIDDPVAKQKNSDSFVFAHITFPKNPNDGMEEMSVKADKCPKHYTETNGIAYFLSDTAHSTQFAFFSIGQYVINGPNNTTWQNTIQFLK